MELPGDIPISDLLPLLLEICGPTGLLAADTGNIKRSPWCLKAVNASELLKTNLTLVDAQVLDGAILVLQEMMAVQIGRAHV